MRRTFNYTGRKRITRDRISITLNRDGEIIKSFDASIRLAEMDLPDDGSVYVEAYHRTELMRYCFGTVGIPAMPGNTELSHLGYHENLRFRVMVIDESNERGLILASERGIQPALEGEEAYRKRCILPVDFTDLGRQVWRIAYDGDQPVLLLNKNVPNISHLARSDFRFFFYVYPAVIREILTNMVFAGAVEDSEDPAEEWCRNWLEFAKQILPNDHLPEALNPEDDAFNQTEVFHWIDRVVEEFCGSRSNEWRRFIDLAEGS